MIVVFTCVFTFVFTVWFYYMLLYIFSNKEDIYIYIVGVKLNFHCMVFFDWENVQRSGWIFKVKNRWIWMEWIPLVICQWNKISFTVWYLRKVKWHWWCPKVPKWHHLVSPPGTTCTKTSLKLPLFTSLASILALGTSQLLCYGSLEVLGCHPIVTRWYSR